MKSPCSLEAEARAERRVVIERDLLPHLLGSATLPDGVALEFAASPELRRELEAFVEFERKCCGGLRFELRDGSAEKLELRVQGEGAEIFAPRPHRD